VQVDKVSRDWLRRLGFQVCPLGGSARALGAVTGSLSSLLKRHGLLPFPPSNSTSFTVVSGTVGVKLWVVMVARDCEVTPGPHGQ
jgi:hypothetical protein